ncbi:hypothetical protein JCM10207_008389 [Rhodosporidiobolus poonsookiae]
MSTTGESSSHRTLVDLPAELLERIARLASASAVSVAANERLKDEAHPLDGYSRACRKLREASLDSLFTLLEAVAGRITHAELAHPYRQIEASSLTVVPKLANLTRLDFDLSSFYVYKPAHSAAAGIPLRVLFPVLPRLKSPSVRSADWFSDLTSVLELSKSLEDVTVECIYPASYSNMHNYGGSRRGDQGKPAYDPELAMNEPVAAISALPRLRVLRLRDSAEPLVQAMAYATSPIALPPNLRSIDIKCSEACESILRFVALFASTVENLVITATARPSEDPIPIFSQPFPALRTLSVRHHATWLFQTDLSLAPNLVALEIEDDRTVFASTQDDFPSLAQRLPRLALFSLFSNGQPSGHEPPPFTDTAAAALTSYCLSRGITLDANVFPTEWSALQARLAQVERVMRYADALRLRALTKRSEELISWLEWAVEPFAESLEETEEAGYDWEELAREEAEASGGR